jgi:hypothetical protein
MSTPSVPTSTRSTSALGLIGQLLDTISAGNKPQPAEVLKPNNGYRPYDFGGARTNDWLVY